MENVPGERHTHTPISPEHHQLDFGNISSNYGAQGAFYGNVTITQHVTPRPSAVATEPPKATLQIFLEHLNGLYYTADLRLSLAPGSGEEALIDGQPPMILLDPSAFAAPYPDPSSYGQQLGELLFSNQRMREGLAYARERARRAHTLLRLQICLAAEDDTSQSLYWELLTDPDGASLALNERVLLSRGFSSGELTPITIRSKDKGELRALIAIPTPDTAALEPGPELDVAIELVRIREALSDMAIVALAQGDGRQPASLDMLDAALASKPDIVVLLVCGEFQGGQPHVWLDAPGGPRCVEGDLLIDLIDRMRQPPCLVVLQSEPRARPDSQLALIALGAQLAAVGVGGVLVFQPHRGEKGSRLLATFFRELRRDGRADRALAMARRGERERPDWWRATLLLRTGDGRLWASESPTQKEATEPPPPPARPPEPGGMVGRIIDLAALEAQLAAQHCAILVGMPGIGKTTLATALARRTALPERIIWHRFSSGQGFETLVWLLAGTLAHHGQSGLWDILQHDRRAGGSLPPTDVLIGYLLQHMTDRGYVLCLDDFHLVDDDRQIEQLIAQLLPELQRGALQLIVTSRRTPAFAQDSSLNVVAGLSRPDLDALLDARGLELEAQSAEAIWRQTGGNPQLLILAIDRLKHGLPTAQLVRDLLVADDIERYLLSEVDAGLLPEERAVIETVAVLLEEGGTRQAIEALLNSSARRLLRTLSDRYLLLSQQTAAGKSYRLHAIMQTFYYDDIPRSRCQELHGRAADYYQHESDSALRAAVHAARAGQHTRAADLATTDIWRTISAGQGRTLDTLLDTLASQPLDEARWLAVAFAHGQVAALLRPGEQARARYQAVLDRLGNRLDTPMRRLLAAQACRGMADLLEQQQKAEALAWLRRGFELLGDADPVEQATLHCRTAALLTSTGDYDEAMEALTQCLALLPPDADSARAKAIANLGLIACFRGTLSEGQARFCEALAIYQRTGQHYLEIGMLINLGNLQVLQGAWSAALATYEQAVQQAHELGLVGEQMELHLNIGFLQTRLWEPERALATFASLQQTITEHGSAENATYLQINQADLYIRLARWDEAAHALIEAERLAQALDLRGQQPEIYRHRALIRLAEGHTDSALEDARHAVDLCRALGEPLAEGTCLRVWGQALLAVDHTAAALEAFAYSAALLADDAYELACTQMTWGTALRADDAAQARALLELAQTTFQQLGARRDCALAHQHLQAAHNHP